MSVQIHLGKYNQSFSLPADFVGKAAGSNIYILNPDVTPYAIKVLQRISKGKLPDHAEPCLEFLHRHIPLDDLLIYANPLYTKLKQSYLASQKNRIFTEAIQLGQTRFVEYMLRQGVDVNSDELLLCPSKLMLHTEELQKQCSELGFQWRDYSSHSHSQIWLGRDFWNLRGFLVYATILNKAEILRVMFKYGAIVTNEQPLIAALAYRSVDALDVLLDAPGYDRAKRYEYVAQTLIFNSRFTWTDYRQAYLQWIGHLAKTHPKIDWNPYYPQKYANYFPGAVQFFGEMGYDLTSHDHAIIKHAFRHADVGAVAYLLKSRRIGIKILQDHFDPYAWDWRPYLPDDCLQIWQLLLGEPTFQLRPEWKLVSLAVKTNSIELLKTFLQDRRLGLIPDAREAWELAKNKDPTIRQILQNDERILQVVGPPGCRCIIM